MRRWGWAGALTLLTVLLASLAPPARAGEGCAGAKSYTEGYLTNGGFEEDFYPAEQDLIGQGWTRVNLDGTPNWTSTFLFVQNNGGHRERIECEDSQILTGTTWQVGQPYHTVIFQRVTGLTPGQPYSFSGWISKFWGGPSENRPPPPDPYALGSWIGYDPTGGTDPTAPAVVWSAPDWDDAAHGYVNHHMAAVPHGDALTVFVRVQHKWQKGYTVVFVDALELFDAPRATLHTPSGPVTEPQVTLHWSGEVPPMLQQRGAFAMYYAVQRQQPDGSWATLADELRETTYTLTLAEAERTTLRVLPYAKQPPGSAGQWPPSTHIGLPTEAVTLTWGEPTRFLPFHLFVPQVVN